MAGRVRRRVAASLAVITCTAVLWGSSSMALAQITGDEAEMKRLQTRAEEAIANGDADGAAMTIGKAALMASELAKHQTDQATVQLFRGAETLFRAQENAYRALALYQRAGGQPPASAGVCSSVRLATGYARESLGLLRDPAGRPAGETPDMAETGRILQAQRLHADAADWLKIIDGLNTDFQCR